MGLCGRRGAIGARGLEGDMKASDEMRLYDISVEKLNLPIRIINICLRQGVTSIGDCIDAIEMMIGGVGTSTSLIFQEAMLQKVVPKLIQQGYLNKEVSALNSDNFAPETIAEIKEKLIEKGYWKSNLSI